MKSFIKNADKKFTNPPSQYVLAQVKKGSEQEKFIMDDSKLLQAVYYYYNMQLSYGPMFLGWPSSVYLKNDRYTKIVKKLENQEIKKVPRLWDFRFLKLFLKSKHH